MTTMPGLNARILIAAGLGLLSGGVLHALGPGHALTVGALPVLQAAGGVFVDLLKMVLVPLVFSSVASGVASLGEHDNAGRVWRAAMTYYLGTTLLASLLGLGLMNLATPGQGLTLDMFREAMASAPAAPALDVSGFLARFLRGLFMNPVKAMAEGAVLPTVVFALLLGLAIARQRERAARLGEWLHEALDVILVIVGGLMQLAPLGIFALLAHLVATQTSGLFLSLALFIAVILAGLLIHGLIVLPGLLFILTGRRPLGFLVAVQESLLTAFATCSSSATLAVTLRVARDRLGVSPRIARFMLPLGATINMDGTALYEAGAALFVANLSGIELHVTQQAVVCLMAILASIGAPGLPSAGMVTLVMVLQSVGLPVEAIAILLPVDRLIDAFRTAINVEGDLIGSAVVDHLHRSTPPRAERPRRP